MKNPSQLLAVKPVRKWGHSHVVSLSAEVRSALGVKCGDQITFRKCGQFVYLSVIRTLVAVAGSDGDVRQAREAVGG